MTNEELYKNLQTVSKKIAERRLRLVRHCLRHPKEIASRCSLATYHWKQLVEGEKQQLS